MNKTHLDVLRNQIQEKKTKSGNKKMSVNEYLMNKEIIDQQLNVDIVENLETV